jgi:hypothetical protein
MLQLKRWFRDFKMNFNPNLEIMARQKGIIKLKGTIWGALLLQNPKTDIWREKRHASRIKVILRSKERVKLFMSLDELAKQENFWERLWEFQLLNSIYSGRTSHKAEWSAIQFFDLISVDTKCDFPFI